MRGRVAPGAKATAGVARRKAVANFIVKYFFERFVVPYMEFHSVDDIRQDPRHTFVRSFSRHVFTVRVSSFLRTYVSTWSTKTKTYYVRSQNFGGNGKTFWKVSKASYSRQERRR